MNSFFKIKKGEIFAKLGKDLNRKEIIEKPDYYNKNIIVDVASELIAEWSLGGNPGHSQVDGIRTLAVGTGAMGWDLQNPPAATSSQTLLESELARKTFASTTYIDGGGDPTVTRTSIVDYTTTFLEAEAVGPLVEMGLFGGTNATVTNDGTMMNYHTFKVINKPNTSQLSIIWRLTF